MSNVISAVDFFVDTLKQDVITLSMHSGQAEIITLEALDGFVVQAATKGLLVEVWIEGERRDYEFGDYVELLKRESNRVDISNPFLDDALSSKTIDNIGLKWGDEKESKG